MGAYAGGKISKKEHSPPHLSAGEASHDIRQEESSEAVEGPAQTGVLG